MILRLVKSAYAKRARQNGDDGVALLLAIIFVLTVSLVVAALLPYTETGIKTASAVADVRTVQNAVDGTVDEAINSIRGSFVLGTTPLCSANQTNTYTPKVAYPSSADAASVNVVVDYCNAPLASGPSTSTTPPFAIQTLRGGVTTDGNNTMLVTGGILSSGAVTFSPTGTGNNQSLNVDGDVYAMGACSAKNLFVVSGVEHCAGLAADPTNPNIGPYNGPSTGGSDPDPTVDPLASLDSPFATWDTYDYVSGTDTQLTEQTTGVSAGLPSAAASVDPLGKCDPSNANSVVTFSPGFYSQTPQTDPVTCTGTKHTVWWFTPGDYYFDFPDSKFNDPLVNPGEFSDSNSNFGVNGTLILGGTPLNWVPGSGSGSGGTDNSTAIINLYKNDPDHTKPACDVDKPGVTFAFGGPTQLSIGTGGSQSPDRLELCSNSVGAQSISLFGLRATDGYNGATIASRSATSTSKTATVALPVATTYLTPTAASAIEGDCATVATDCAAATLTAGAVTSATMTYSGFNLNSIPAGSLITQAKLRVDWSTACAPTTTCNTSHVLNTLSFSPSSAAAWAGGNPLTLGSGTNASGDQSIAVTIPTTDVTWRALKTLMSGLSVKFTADGSNLSPAVVCAPKQKNCTPSAAESEVSSLDGVQLEVKYIPPALEPVRCAGATGTTPACNILTNKVDDTLFLHGTVYTPQSILEAAVHNYSSTVFERGVIADTLIAHLSSSAKQTLPPFQLPKGSIDRTVRFTAWTLNPDGTRERKRLVAVVHYVDFVTLSNGKTLASPGHSANVLEWTVMR